MRALKSAAMYPHTCTRKTGASGAGGGVGAWAYPNDPTMSITALASNEALSVAVGARPGPSSGTTSLPMAAQVALVGVGLPVTPLLVQGNLCAIKTAGNIGRQQSLSFHSETTDFVLKGSARRARAARSAKSRARKVIPGQ